MKIAPKLITFVILSVLALVFTQISSPQKPAEKAATAEAETLSPADQAKASNAKSGLTGLLTALTCGVGCAFLGSIRTIRDANLIQAKALPAAAATANGGSIDLGAKAGPVLERCELRLECEDLPSLVDTKKATFTFEHSDDNAAFAAIPELAQKVLTGDGGNGIEGFTQEVRLPSSVKRYVRVSCAVEAAGGDNTAKKFTLSLLG